MTLLDGTVVTAEPRIKLVRDTPRTEDVNRQWSGTLFIDDDQRAQLEAMIASLLPADADGTKADPRCPHCGGLLESDPDDASEWLWCPLCKTEVLLTDETETKE